MSVITLKGIGQTFGDFDVFRNVTGSIPVDGKVGLVGPNGIGKTTLLLILTGQMTPSQGSLHLAKGTRIGYLTQEAMHAFEQRENTVYAEMLTVFAALRAEQARLHKMEDQIASGDFDDALLDQYSDAQLRLELAGGFDYELRIKRVLDGLGFDEESRDWPLNILSGGQKTRALLARLLLEQPDLLILDEPTNHLDVEAIEWLESALRTWDGAVLIVSHDRYFLDRTVNTIWEMSRAGVEIYRGNYSHYITQREERWELRQREFDAMQANFLKELDYVKRNIARDSTKDMAVGRLKRLIRQVKMAEVGGSEAVLGMSWARAMDKFGISGAKWEVPDVEAAIKGLPRPSGRLHQMNIHLQSEQRSGKLVLRTYDLQVGYPDNVLFSADNIELHRLECAALIGPNGSGKSTFLKTLLGELEPQAGEFQPGASLKIGYFAQAHDELDLSLTVIDQLLQRHPMMMSDARNYLGRYLFRGDDVFKPISLLSGGERGRLALAILALEGANFLLLDEPTNHLDIPAQEALQAVLEQFEGTILMVTHDRYLVDKLATQVWALDNERLRVYEGGYQAYLAARQRVDSAEKESAPPPPASETDADKPTLSKNELWRRQQALAEIEARIHSAETEAARWTTEIQAAGAAQDFERLQKASAAYEKAQATLEKLMDEWADLAEHA